ncbi:DUF7504 family protein [Haloarcula sp. GH36]|uniref:DUF7504 family protein n=1 Tax=Haloarcula montana TaxID=3111776 RepID=UPI002D77A4E1|nr:hypothetical protein [Haloarcula sp. GH36]
MSSNDDVGRSSEEKFRLDTGGQALVSVSTMQSPIRELPPTAYENLLVVSASAPEEVAETLDTAGVALTSVGHIPISGSETAYQGEMGVCEPFVPDDLTGLSMRLSRAFEALEDGLGWVVFDNLNVFLMYAAEERVVRFFDHTTTQARKHGICGSYGVVRDAVDDSTYARLRRCVDTEIDLR